jgi:PhnB protein
MNEATEISASTDFHYLRPGLTSITPYIVARGTAHLIEFLQSAFGATEQLRIPAPDGSIMHAQLALGNGAIEVSDGGPPYVAAPGAIHLYVDDADSTFERALQAGATTIYPVADQHWGDRQGAAKDRFGNHWYIAEAGWDPGPNSIPSVQPFLHVRDAHAMIAFLQAAFAAESLGVAESPEGAVLHATIRIGNATLEINEAHDQFQPMPCHLHLYVPDTDTTYADTLKAGATSIEAPVNKPYGDRSAAVKDAWGNSWLLATYLAK